MCFYLKKKKISKNNFPKKKQNTNLMVTPGVRLATTASRTHFETTLCTGNITLHSSEGSSPSTGDL